MTKIKCMICENEFSQITAKHLKKHNITPEEYKIKYNISSLISEEAQQKKLSSIKETEKTLSRKAWNAGMPLSQDQKKILSDKAKARIASEGHWNSGGILSEETKSKISNSLKGKNHFTDESLEKRNITIQNKKLNGWVSPLKNKKLSEPHKNKIIKPLLKSNEHKSIDCNNVIKEKCKQNNLQLLKIEDNYYLTLQCLTCNTTFNNTRQVFRESKNNGINLCPQCFPKAIVVSNAEIELRNYIQEIYSNNTIFNERSKLNGKEIDIYLPDLNIGIEYNGLYWHSTEEEKDYHIMHKMQHAFKNGIRLVTIYEDEWIDKNAIVKSYLNNLIASNQKIASANTEVMEIDENVAKKFIENNSLHHEIGQHNISLNLNNEIYFLLSFNIIDGTIFFVNACTKNNFTVIGGYEKVLEYIKTKFTINQMIAYSDRRLYTGNVYKKLGFTFFGTTMPSAYTVENEKRIPFDLNKKRKIFDCGKSIWIWKN